MRLDVSRREMDVSLSLFRSIDRPAFDETSRKAMGRIADHLRRALLLSATLKQARLRAATSETILEYVGNGILLVNEKGQLIHATASAIELLKRRPGLRIVNGHVNAVSAQDSQVLQELIRRAAALTGKIPSSGTMPIRQADSPHPLVVSVFPVPYSHETFRGHSRHRVLLILNDAGHKRFKNSELFGRYYSLTARELQLCCALAEGKDMAAACALLGIRPNTARTHLINVFAKVGVHRQSDLVALILSFG
jgi:DNA-binding CsgD family transcriptional regulator